jgi:hypothetical protein
MNKQENNAQQSTMTMKKEKYDNTILNTVYNLWMRSTIPMDRALR